MQLRPCFFFNETATTEIYTLSLHDALPISHDVAAERGGDLRRVLAQQGGIPTVMRSPRGGRGQPGTASFARLRRSEEHTSELQSRQYLVCRLLLEKKRKSSDSHQVHTAVLL